MQSCVMSLRRLQYDRTSVQYTPDDVPAAIERPTSSAGGADSTSADTRERYFFVTKHGSSEEKYYEFLKTLPDQGQGLVSQSDGLNFQSYVTYLARLEVENVVAESIVALSHRNPAPEVNDDRCIRPNG